MSSNNYILLNQCFYIQTCYCETTNETNCCDAVSCVKGSILFVFNCTGKDTYTDTYYVNYYVVNNTDPPNPISGLANKILNNHYEAVFNDQSVFRIYFSNNELNIGQINIVTPTIVGNFCIINIDLYNSFYSKSTPVLQ